MSRLAIARCSSLDVPKPANDGIGMPALFAAWFVDRVNGGFMMTRSQDLSLIVMECSLRLSDFLPPMDAPVANRE